MKITLGVTQDCNLRCTYCYAGKKIDRVMDIATAKKIVDFAFAITPPSELIDFGFFGGEPLLELGLIDDIITYIYSKKSTRPVSFNITTNGTIFNDAVSQFVRKYGIKLSISIDGPEHIHDRNRKDKYGQGTLKTILENIKRISSELDYFQVNAVYDPNSVTMLNETVRFLIQENIRSIHLNPDISARWSQKDLPSITKSYTEVADTYIDMFQNNQEVAINLLDNKMILFLKGGYETSDCCGMGESEFGFAPSGNVYPCERLIGDDNDTSMMMGNVNTGVNLLARCAIGKRTTSSNTECIDCSFKKYCMNWCGCTNYHMSGSADTMSAMMCHSERQAVGAAKHVFQTLQENPLFMEHMIRYIQKDENTQERG